MSNISSKIINNINYRLDNIKYYTIKLLLESHIHSSPYLKNILKKYGASQLLFTFFSSTLINNMFYNKDNIMSNYRIFIAKLGRWKFNKEDHIPINGNCSYMHDRNITCHHDIMRIFCRSFTKLFILYSNLSLVLILYKLYNKKQINIISLVSGIIKSASFLSLFGALYRVVMCYHTNTDHNLSVFTSQCGLTLGSIAFQLESPNRRPIINRYLLSLYIHDLTSQLGLNGKIWNYIFIIALLYSIKMRSIGKTALTLLL